MTPGKSTSEWLATLVTVGGSMMPLLAGVINTIRDSGVVQNNFLMMLLGMVSSLLATMGYTAGRSYVKAAYAKSEALKAASLVTELPGTARLPPV